MSAPRGERLVVAVFAVLVSVLSAVPAGAHEIPASAATVTLQSPGEFFGLGVAHILLGVDHLLFVFGLLLLVDGRVKALVQTVTAFTLAHSLTLAAATLGTIRVPSAPLNAAIAASILFLGVEVAKARRGAGGLSWRYPWAMAFGFGLLHGLGFATGLSTLGLAGRDVVGALLFFNLGVEAGQLGFILLCLALARALAVLETPRPAWALALPGFVVGVAGAYWTIRQTAILW